MLGVLHVCESMSKRVFKRTEKPIFLINTDNTYSSTFINLCKRARLCVFVYISLWGTKTGMLLYLWDQQPLWGQNTCLHEFEDIFETQNIFFSIRVTIRLCLGYVIRESIMSGRCPH